MVYKGYKAILKTHGLRLKYDDGLKQSIAFKTYKDDSGKRGLLILRRKKGLFEFLCVGKGLWKDYFEVEISVLRKRLSPFGKVRVVA